MTQQTALLEKSNDYTELEREYFDVTNVSLIDPINLPLTTSLNKRPSATIVIPARNVKFSILACLTSIEQSSFNIKYQNRLQVVVVDDGSNDETWEIVKNSKLSLNLTAVRQQHCGQAQALNTGISVAENDIIICCDADMVLSYYAIEQFVTRHQLFSNTLLVGFRSDTPISDPRVNPEYICRNGSHKQSCFSNDERITFPIPGWPTNMCLASDHFKKLGNFRSLWMPDGDAWLLPDLVFGALFSLSKSTYFEIGGYDERFVGWGCNDGYLASKAIAAGNYIVPTYAASGLHISHPARSGNKQIEYEKNRQLFFKLIESSKVGYFPNWLNKAKDRTIELFTRKSTRRNFAQLKKSPEQKVPKHFEVDSLLALGKYSKAISVLLNSSTQNNKGQLLKMGKAFYGMGEYENAILAFKEVSVSFPEAAIELALAQAAIGKFSQAHKTLKEFAQKEPTSSFLSYWYNQPIQKHINQGVNYLNQGFYNIALRCFEAALMGEPKNRDALKYRNKCLVK